MSPPSWQEAAAGLDTHRNAILFRIVIAIVGVLYVATLLISDSREPPSGVFALLIGVGEMCATLMALMGVVRFAAKVPERARATASFASFALIAVIVGELYALWVGWRMVQFASAASHATSAWSVPPVGDLLEQVDRLPYISMAAGIAGLLAVLTVLGSISSVGHALSDDALVRRAQRMSIAVVLLGVGYGLIERWSIHAGGPLAIAALAVLAVFALGTLFAYIGVLTTASDAMRSGAVAIPSARAR